MCALSRCPCFAVAIAGTVARVPATAAVFKNSRFDLCMILFAQLREIMRRITTQIQSLRTRRRVMRVRAVGKSPGIQHMDVAVDLRLVEDSRVHGEASKRSPRLPAAEPA